MVDINKIVSWFEENPKRLEISAGKLVRGERGRQDLFEGVTVADIYEAKAIARANSKSEDITSVPPSDLKFEEDIKAGTAVTCFSSPEEIRDLEALIKYGKIDTSKWEITKYVQNYWGNAKDPHWQVKAWLSVKKDESLFQDKFIEFLKIYTPLNKEIPFFGDRKKAVSCLVFNKQDAHLNKKDIDGDNDIDRRFGKVILNTMQILEKATAVNYLETVVYIIGSDEFNSEWTAATTKGTPQSNILSYEEGFKRICDHEVGMINLLKQKTDNLKVIYLPGNHDHYVGWHMINWLETYFRNEEGITFDSSTKCTKYIKWDNTALMLNHGDDIKPEKMASMFPMGFKEGWSSCDNHYIMCGDKHHTLAKDFNGIQFYQIPALSSAKSLWDDKKGHLYTKAEMTAFLIEAEIGMTDIMKRPM